MHMRVSCSLGTTYKASDLSSSITIGLVVGAESQARGKSLFSWEQSTQTLFQVFVCGFYLTALHTKLHLLTSLG